jgi:cobyrinic acid a,c-diamide synthase
VRFTTPRLVVAGLSGDSGKTLVSLGIASALRKRGVDVAPFKKGPDYIDAAWLGAATGRPGRNLDTFLQGPEALGAILARGGCDESKGLALVEGNRGLFDGSDAAGTHSTAELAKRLGAPVVLVVDATKSTRTVAALVLGCRALDPDVPLAGVVLNRVATPRQERVIREALEQAGGPPVLGAVPRIGEDPLPGRQVAAVDLIRILGSAPQIILKRCQLVAARAPACRPARRAGVGGPQSGLLDRGAKTVKRRTSFTPAEAVYKTRAKGVARAGRIFKVLQVERWGKNHVF